MISPLARRHLLLIASLLGLSVPGPILAECSFEPAGADRAAEQARIEACLRHVARAPRDDERALYTYGSELKLQKMQDLSARDFCRYEGARQRKTEEIRFRRDYQEGGAITLTPAKLETARLERDRTHDLQGIYDREKALGIGALPVEVWPLVALDKVYPGLIKRIELDPLEELRALRRSSTRKKPLTRGKIAGISQNYRDGEFQIGAGARKSDSTGGNGLYMASDPLSYMNHYVEGSGALRCTTTPEHRIVDLEDPPVLATLREARIVTPIYGTGRAGPEDFYWFPNNRRNIWQAPKELEAAAKALGVIVKFRSPTGTPYLSKCGLDTRWGEGRTCDALRIEDFSCRDFARFVGSGFRNAAFFVRDRHRDPRFIEGFYTTWDRCITEDRPRMCGANHALLRSLPGSVAEGFLQRETPTRFTQMLQSCGCRVTDAKNFMCPKTPEEIQAEIEAARP